MYYPSYVKVRFKTPRKMPIALKCKYKNLRGALDIELVGQRQHKRVRRLLKNNIFTPLK